LSALYVDCFSVGLEDMKGKEQGYPRVILRVSAKTKRFSVFGAIDSRTIANTVKRGYVTRTGGEFPSTNVELTDDGRALLAQSGEVEG
jgi:DNA-binding MarR family transcriptional regulator